MTLIEHDHILGMSFSRRPSFTHISIWTKQGSNLRSIMILERAILSSLSPELRPTSHVEFSYRKHLDKLLETGSTAGVPVPIWTSSFPLGARPGLPRPVTTN